VWYSPLEWNEVIVIDLEVFLSILSNGLFLG